MLAFVTGASSGIGREIARILSRKGYDLIITARNEKKLNQLKKELQNKYKSNIGEFWKTDLNTEMDMLKVNDFAMHILFKLVLKDMLNFTKENKDRRRYILNVSSLSGFVAGPKMSTYYASKAYMLNLTRGVYKELKMKGLDKRVSLSVLCPRTSIYKFL